VVVSSDETAPRHLTAEEFKKLAAVNCRGVLWPFNGVFQPYNMCEQQFSLAIDSKF